jgi:hypothetical protein
MPVILNSPDAISAVFDQTRYVKKNSKNPARATLIEESENAATKKDKEWDVLNCRLCCVPEGRLGGRRLDAAFSA